VRSSGATAATQTNPGFINVTFNQNVDTCAYLVTTGLDNYNDGMANARPAGVPRNSLQGPGYADLDLRWSHDFYLVRAKKDKGPMATLGIDAFDVLNHVNYPSDVGVQTSPFFGRPVSAQPGRRLQLSFRFRF